MEPVENHERLHQSGGAKQQQNNSDGPLGDKAARRFGCHYGVGGRA